MIKRIVRAVFDGFLAFAVICAVGYGFIIGASLLFGDGIPAWVRIAAILLLSVIVVHFITREETKDDGNETK